MKGITNTAIVKRSLPKRYRSERRFRLIGLGAILIGLSFVALLFYTITSKGYSAFTQTYIQLPVVFDEESIDPEGRRDPGVLARADYNGLIKSALRGIFPEVAKRKEKKALYSLISNSAKYQLQGLVTNKLDLLGQTQSLWLPADDEVDMYIKGYATSVKRWRPKGAAEIVLKGDRLYITSSESDFGGLLRELRDDIRIQIVRLKRDLTSKERQLAGEQDNLKNFEQRLEEAQKYQHTNSVNNFNDRITETKASINTLVSDIDFSRRYIAELEAALVDTNSRLNKPKDSSSLIARINGGIVKVDRISPDTLEGKILVPLYDNGAVSAGGWELFVLETPENERRIDDKSIAWIETLRAQGLIERKFNRTFFTHGDSREPEQAGIAGALMGSLFTLLVTLALSFPIGVAAAIYLEEFAPKNKWSDLIEININNLAAVPSIVFGLLGLAVFINFFGLPRSAPVVGGFVLTLMTLPTIIIASRAALKAVPPSIREAALGMGASRMQAVFHHVLPLALPGMMTGSIIGMAQALGETAPLLMIGMVAFIVDIPGSISDPATVLPVQIYLWADSPERAFVERTSAAIMVLLLFLILMNTLAVLLRKRFERRW